MFSIITEHPSNTLVVRCLEDNVVISCNSTHENEITWTYDGGAAISGACQPNGESGVFQGYSLSPYDCNINASLSKAVSQPAFRTISGLYGCTDRHNHDVIATSMVVVLGMFLNANTF